MHHGDKIKELLKYTKMDKTELALKLDATRQTVYNMLKRKRIKSVMLDRLANIFNVPVSFFDAEESIDEWQETYEGTYSATTIKECKLRLKNALDQIKLMNKIIDEKERTIQDKEQLIEAKNYIIKTLEKSIAS